MLIVQKTNRWHKPVHIYKRDETMLKFKKSNTNKVSVAIVFDKSSSMRTYVKEAVDSLNAQIASFASEATKNNLPTEISIVTFSDEATVELTRVDATELGLIEQESYQPYGNTSIYKGLRSAIEILESSNSSRKVILLVTDGEENRSNTGLNPISQWEIKNRIAKLNKDQYTLIACMPANGYYQTSMQDLGFPAGNITQWETNARGMNNLTSQVQTSNTMLYTAYRSGATRSVNFFQPQVQNLSQSVVQSKLQDVTKDFTTLTVDGNSKDEMVISNFVARKGYTYSPGKCFYELTKKEKVQDHKAVVLQHVNTGKIYYGDAVRDILQIPSGGTIDLHPAFSPDYKVFIRSMSWNRNLVKGTTLLMLNAKVRTINGSL